MEIGDETLDLESPVDLLESNLAESFDTAVSCINEDGA